MKIANPIYDAAFLYLLEDTEIAKALIGEIIKEEIEGVLKVFNQDYKLSDEEISKMRNVSLY